MDTKEAVTTEKTETSNDLKTSDLPDLKSVRSRSTDTKKTTEETVSETGSDPAEADIDVSRDDRQFFLDKMDFLAAPYTLANMGDEIFTTIRVGRKWFDTLSEWLPTKSDYLAEAGSEGKPVYLDCYNKVRQDDGSFVTGSKVGRYEVLWVNRIDTFRDVLSRSSRTNHMCKGGASVSALEEFLKRTYTHEKVSAVSADPNDFFTVIGMKRVSEPSEDDANRIAHHQV